MSTLGVRATDGSEPLRLANASRPVVILGLDPRIHAATSADERDGARNFCTAAFFGLGHGMDPRVYATELRSCFALG